jgi:hypothetical protein
VATRTEEWTNGADLVDIHASRAEWSNVMRTFKEPRDGGPFYGGNGAYGGPPYGDKGPFPCQGTPGDDILGVAEGYIAELYPYMKVWDQIGENTVVRGRVQRATYSCRAALYFANMPVEGAAVWEDSQGVLTILGSGTLEVRFDRDGLLTLTPDSDPNPHPKLNPHPNPNPHPHPNPDLQEFWSTGDAEPLRTGKRLPTSPGFS